MNDFEDKQNYVEIINGLSDLKSYEQVEAYICDQYPGWILGSFKKYSVDYPHLTENWAKICEMVGAKAQKILLVAGHHTSCDEQHKTIQFFCEYLTRLGYIIRKADEFIPCTRCSAAIPVEEMWIRMLRGGMNVPHSWRTKCAACSQS